MTQSTITFNSSQKILVKMDQSPFWICWLFQMVKADLRPLSIGRQHTQTNTCIGTAIMSIPSKYSMIGTLFHWAKTICSEPKHLQDEEEHLYRTLKKCKYPTRALNRVKVRNQTTLPKKKKNNRTINNNQEHKPHITVPYHQGLSESFKRTCRKLWYRGELERRTHHQEPPNEPQGQRSYPEKEWGYIQI